MTEQKEQNRPLPVFGWKTVLIMLGWALIVLMPGYLIGPVHLQIHGVVLAVDPTFLLEIIGGILFGIWGGVFCPLIGFSAAHLVNLALTGPLFLASLPVHIANATILPLVRHRSRESGAHSLRWRLAYWALGGIALPLLNGVLLTYAWPHLFGETLKSTVIAPFLLNSLGFALLFLFPGLFLFGFVQRAAGRAGWFLQDRWSRWSRPNLGLRRPAAGLLAVALAFAPLTGVAFVARYNLAKYESMSRSSFLFRRSNRLQDLGRRIDFLLRRQKEILDITSWMMMQFIYNPEKVNTFLLDVLKSHRGILNLEYIPRSSADYRLRLRYFIPDDDELDALPRLDFRLTPLKRGDDGVWSFSLGKKIISREGTELGWLFMRCEGRRVVAFIEAFQRPIPADSRVLLVTGAGQVIYGDGGKLLFQKDKSVQYYVGPDGRRKFLVHSPLLNGLWEVVFLESYRPQRGVQMILPELTRWSILVQGSLLLILFGVAVWVMSIGGRSDDGEGGSGASTSGDAGAEPPVT